MLETSFRIHRDEVTRTLIGCPPMAKRQKIGFDPIATERRLRRNGRWKRQRQNGNGMVETRHESLPSVISICAHSQSDFHRLAAANLVLVYCISLFLRTTMLC